MTSLKELPPPSAAAAAPAAADAWQRFFAYAFDKSRPEQAAVSAGRSALLKEDPALDEPQRRDCTVSAAAVVIDLDDGQDALVPERMAAAPAGVAEGLAHLRDAGVVVLWISKLPAARAADAARALRNSGLDPRRQDQLLLLRRAQDRKQLLREDVSDDVCIVAIAGDRRSDFDELFDYLRNPGSAAGLDAMLGNGWFLVSHARWSGHSFDRALSRSTSVRCKARDARLCGCVCNYHAQLPRTRTGDLPMNSRLIAALSGVSPPSLWGPSPASRSVTIPRQRRAARALPRAFRPGGWTLRSSRGTTGSNTSMEFGLKTNEIPADRSSIGSFYLARLETEKRQGQLLADILKSDPAAGSNDALIKNYYQAYTNQQAIDAAGLAPVKPDLDRYAAIGNKADLVKILGDQTERPRLVQRQQRHVDREPVRPIRHQGTDYRRGGSIPVPRRPGPAG